MESENRRNVGTLAGLKAVLKAPLGLGIAASRGMERLHRLVLLGLCEACGSEGRGIP